MQNLIKYLIGFIIGAAAMFCLGAAQELGLLSSPSPITKESLIEKISCTKFDNHPEWFIESTKNDHALITLQQPLHRQQYVISNNDLGITEVPNKKANYPRTTEALLFPL